MLLRGTRQRLQRARDRAGEGQVGAKAAQRIAREERVGAEVDDLGFGPRPAFLRNPRYVAVDHQHEVRFVEQRVRIPSAVHRVLGGEREIARPVMDNRHGKGLGELADRPGGFRGPAAVRRDEERALRSAEQARGLLEAVRIGGGRRGGDEGRHTGKALPEALRQDLARQRDVDRPLRLGFGDRQGSIQHGFDLLGMAQLVVPLHELAQHRALVEVLLRPVDVVVARGGQGPGLGDRGASCGEQEGHVLARGIDEAVQGVGGAHADVDHHGLGPAGDHGVAVRHGDAHVLVRHDHDFGQAPAELLPLGIGLDDWGEVGAAVGKEIVDAARGEQADPGVGGGFRGEGHGRVGLHAAMLRRPSSKSPLSNRI